MFVQCDRHGRQPATMVCQHVVAGLVERRRVGFFWTTNDSANSRPDAYCTECELRVRKTGGEWVAEALEHLQPKTLCASCYDMAKVFHMGGNPWS
jgi:hypothetical protein